MAMISRQDLHKLASCVLVAAGGVLPSGAARGQDFKEFEIRVIRNKYFVKSSRLEVSGNISAVMNKPFVYTYMGGATLGYHLFESLALYGEGNVGFTLNKADCSTLGETFAIEPIVWLMGWWAGAGLNYTPIYGKYQLASGDVVYFDWFFNAGGGMAGVRARQNSCNPDEANAEQPLQASPQFNFGTGQRFFLSKNAALNWNLRFAGFARTAETDKGFEPNVLLMVGMSYFL